MRRNLKHPPASPLGPFWLSLFLVGLVVWPGRAAAQNLGFADRHRVAISAERLFGYVHTTQSVGGQSTSVDSLTLLTNPIGLANAYSWPRLGVDVFVAPGISVGGSVAYFNISPSAGSITGFMLAPRVGYAAHLGPKVMIWPRGGVTYSHVSVDGGNGGITPTDSAFALTLEVPLAILIPPRVAILVGPTLDVGLSGSTTVGGMDQDQTRNDYGLQSGLLVLF